MALSIWVLSDGKAGDEGQCLGVAHALGVEPEIRRVAPRFPFVLTMPYGPIDPRDAPHRADSPIRPPYPDLLIASGRRAIPYVRHIKHASGGRTFTVILKDPRTGAGSADLIWVPEHDPLRGRNVLVTPTSPHAISPERLAAARAAPPDALLRLPAPRVAVLLGGDSRHHRFSEANIEAFANHLQRLAEDGASLMVTPSRRTPPALREKVAAIVAAHEGFLWDGSGENPYLPMLALADTIVVTADSTNMVSEAAATGAPVLVFEPGGGHRKITAFLDGLRRTGIVHNFEGRLVGDAYQPLDSTIVIAQAIRRALVSRGIEQT